MMHEDITEHSWTDERVRRLLDQQVAVNKLALALGETRDLDKIYRTIYDHIRAMVDAHGFIVSSYDDETQLIRAAYAVYKGTTLDVTGLPPIPLAEPGKGGQSRVIHTGEPLYTPNHRKALETSQTEYVVEEDGSFREGPPEEEEEDITKSALYVPMKIEGQTIGVMQLQSQRLDAYTPRDINLLAALANVAAIAIQNGRLFSDLQQSNEELKKHREHLEEMVAERTAELRKMVNLMAGREVRMAELKGVIRKLRAQLKEAGLEPAANDPLLGEDSQSVP